MKVYSVWLPMVQTDERMRWTPKLLRDERITHYWNEDQSVGRWFTDNVTDCGTLGEVAWDAYYLFDGEATWESTLSSTVDCGTPVFRETDGFAKALEGLFGEEE